LLGVILNRQELHLSDLLNSAHDEAKMSRAQQQLARILLGAGGVLLIFPLLTAYIGREIWYLLFLIILALFIKLIFLFKNEFYQLLQAN